jgi:hypothetical protein
MPLSNMCLLLHYNIMKYNALVINKIYQRAYFLWSLSSHCIQLMDGRFPEKNIIIIIKNVSLIITVRVFGSCKGWLALRYIYGVVTGLTLFMFNNIRLYMAAYIQATNVYWILVENYWRDLIKEREIINIIIRFFIIHYFLGAVLKESKPVTAGNVLNSWRINQLINIKYYN